MRIAVRCITRRVAADNGFGLVELLIALTVLVVGVLATFGVFQSSLLHLGRATKISTAAAVGEQQVENLRAVRFDVIGINPAGWTAALGNATYTGDTACQGTCTTQGSASGESIVGASGIIMPISSATGADGKQYTIHTYALWQTIVAGRSVKKVTIVVRDPVTSKVWARIVSSFDQSIGL